MAELTEKVMYIVENTSYSEDEKQKFYVAWLEMEEPVIVQPINLEYYIKVRMSNMAKNAAWTKRNRKRLLEENKEIVRKELGLDGTSDDPADIVQANAWVEGKLKLLTELQLATLIAQMQGLTYAEIAAEEGTTENVIYQRIHQAKKQLRGDTT